MGLRDKVKQKEAQKPDEALLTPKEAAFVVTKLRQATYQGSEFELFYQVMAKLQALVEK